MADFNTDPGGRSVAELEREVDEQRDRLSRTIDALQEKASVGNIVDQVVRAIGENGGEVSRNLGRTLRDNPLPVLLTGVGLAWLMAGGSRPAPQARWDAYDDDLDDEEEFVPRTAGSGYYDDDLADDPYAAPGGVGYVPYPSSVRAADYAPEEADDRPGLRERAGEALAGARDTASHLAGSAAAQASGLGEAAASGLSQAGEAARHAGQSAARALGDTGHAARRRLRHARRGAQVGLGRRGQDVRDGLEGMLEDQPLVLGALALAVGAAIGGALPNSRAEDRLLGARSESLKRAARGFVEEQGGKVKATAGAVADEALAIADEAADAISDSLPSGSDVVGRAGSRVEEVADRLREAGKAEAERQGLVERPGPTTES